MKGAETSSITGDELRLDAITGRLAQSPPDSWGTDFQCRWQEAARKGGSWREDLDAVPLNNAAVLARRVHRIWGKSGKPWKASISATMSSG